jgi:hypothetical protein
VLPPEYPQGAPNGPSSLHLPQNQSAITDRHRNGRAKSECESWRATLKVNCPCCGEVHEISVSETYINGVLQDASAWLGRGIESTRHGR